MTRGPLYNVLSCLFIEEGNRKLQRRPRISPLRVSQRGQRR